MAYNKNTNYEDLINQAVSSGDMASAAQFEQQRNEKVNDMISSGTNTGGYTTTNLYSQYLNQNPTNVGGSATGTGVHTTMQGNNQQVNRSGGAQWTSNLMQRPSFNYSQYKTDNPMPTYEGSYSAKIDQMLDQILNRDAFSYNPETDVLYQSYKKQYNREGTRSMNDTLAAMASGAGGMNSWAATAAQQANDYYATQLTDKIPELYQLAYDMYLNDIDLQMQDMGLLQQLDATQYDRYRDTMDDWYSDRDFAYGQYRDDMGDYQWDSNFQYGQYRDSVEDDRYKNEWDYAVGRDQLEDERYNRETAYAQVMDFISTGVMPSEAMLSAAGIDAALAQAMLYRLHPDLVPVADAGGSGVGGPGRDKEEEPDNPYTTPLSIKPNALDVGILSSMINSVNPDANFATNEAYDAAAEAAKNKEEREAKEAEKKKNEANKAVQDALNGTASANFWLNLFKK